MGREEAGQWARSSAKFIAVDAGKIAILAYKKRDQVR